MVTKGGETMTVFVPIPKKGSRKLSVALIPAAKNGKITKNGRPSQPDFISEAVPIFPNNL